MGYQQMQERLLGVRQKVKRAGMHLDELKLGLKAFMDSDPFSISLDFETEPEKVTVQILKANAVPAELLPVIGDVIHNLRSALDHLSYALVKVTGKEPSTKNEFPILDGPLTKPKFQKRFEDKLVGMNPEVMEMIRQIRPYKGGNDALWRLHRLDIVDKHQMLIVALGNITAVGGYPRFEEEWKEDQYLSQKEIEPIVLKQGHKLKMNVSAFEKGKETSLFAEVVFNQPGVARGYSVLQGLSRFKQEVSQVISRLAVGLF